MFRSIFDYIYYVFYSLILELNFVGDVILFIIMFMDQRVLFYLISIKYIFFVSQI